MLTRALSSRAAAAGKGARGEDHAASHTVGIAHPLGSPPEKDPVLLNAINFLLSNTWLGLLQLGFQGPEIGVLKTIPEPQGMTQVPGLEPTLYGWAAL